MWLMVHTLSKWYVLYIDGVVLWHKGFVPSLGNDMPIGDYTSCIPNTNENDANASTTTLSSMTTEFSRI